MEETASTAACPEATCPRRVALVNIRTADASSKEPLTAMVKVIGGDRPESDPSVYINITDNQGECPLRAREGQTVHYYALVTGISLRIAGA